MEDEDLPSVSSSSDEVEAAVSEEEELLSVGDSPAPETTNCGEQDEDENAPAPQGSRDDEGDSTSEDLLSVGSSSSSDADANPPPVLEREPSAAENRGSGSASGSGGGGGGDVVAEPVARFRMRVDENGEEVWEFASDEEESEDERLIQEGNAPFVPAEQSDSEDERRGQPLAFPHVPPLNAAQFQPLWDDFLNAHRQNQHQLYQQRRRQISSASEDDSDGDVVQLNRDLDSEDESDDTDYVPHVEMAGRSRPTRPGRGGPSGVGARVASRRGRPTGASVGGERDGPQSSSDQGPSTSRRGGRRGRRKAKRKPASKPKNKKPSISKPQKPLKPKTIYENEFGNDAAQLYETELNFRGSGDKRTVIKIPLASCEDGCSQSSRHKVGQAFLHPQSTSDFPIRYGENLLEQYPGLTQITLHATSFQDNALICIKTEETLPLEESALRPKPRLSPADKRRELIFVIRKSYVFPCKVGGFPLKLFNNRGFGSKAFYIEYCGILEDGSIQLDVYIEDSFITGEHTLDDIPYCQPKMLLETLNSVFLPDKVPDSDDGIESESASPRVTATAEDGEEGSCSQKEDLPWFYGQIKKFHSKEVLPIPEFSLQPEIVGPTLRRYQRDAVRWMLLREGVLKSDDSSTAVDLISAFVKKMYVEVLIGDRPAFYNPYVGYLCWTLPTIFPIPSGGILADEMGLGKTVEVICLVLLNPRPQSQDEEVDDISDSSNSDSENNSQSVNSTDSDSDVTWSSDSDDDTFHQGQKRKRKIRGTNKPLNRTSVRKGKGNAQRRKSIKLQEEDKSDAVEHVHPRLRRRRRALSPCSFATATDEVNATTEQNDDNGITNPCPIPSTSCSPARKLSTSGSPTRKLSTSGSPTRKLSTSGSPTRKLRRTDSTENMTSLDKEDKPKTTYERLKALYDVELRNYDASRARTGPRFHGTFYETKIARVARFECVCGGWNDDNRKVVSCSNCESSQHADCVGFTKIIQKRLMKRGLDYQCPHCVALGEPYKAKTTLIITPATISHQWISELQRHVKKKTLNIFFYKGVSIHGYIQPSKLAEYDIVITTYAVLSSDMAFVDLPHTNTEDGRQFRNSKRFLTIPSPLPHIVWWRVCLDEAQMVEGVSTKMSLMARRLHTIHRWCVTGTPINRSLQDLFGLFAFLGVEPVALDFWWEKLVQEPFYRKDTSLLYEMFGQLIWRTSKMDVLDQLGIPPQMSKVRWLNFSAVEEHFYKQQFEICSRNILEKIARLRQTNSNVMEVRLSGLDRHVLQTLLNPFLELRKACCHPQIVKGQSISLNKGTLTMEELLQQLISKASIQCADDHRLIVAALNGLAGIHMIREEWLEASEKYREVLQSANKNKDHFHTDSLQLLHTLENLADLLDRNHSGLPYTLRDSSLREEAEELKRKYLAKYAAGVRTTKMAVEPLTNSAEDLLQNFKCPRSLKMSWWTASLYKAGRYGKADSLIRRIKEELTTVAKKNPNHIISLTNKFNDVHGLERVLVETILDIENLRKSALDGLEALQQKEADSFVHAAVSCHLRKKSQLYYKPTDEEGFRCEVCQYHDRFVQYESVLFKTDKKEKVTRTGRKWQQRKIMGSVSSELTEEERNLVLMKEEEELIESLQHVHVGLSDDLYRGSWGESETERILKLINSFARINVKDPDIREDATTHLKLFEAMKKEFRLLRILWRQIFDQISAHDELAQASTRLCLRYHNPTTQDEVAGPSNGGSSRRKKKPNKELQDARTIQEQRIQNINVIEPHEIETRLAEMDSDLQCHQNELSLHMGQLLYLESLKKKEGGTKPEPCPICHNPLEQEWSVLKCGHSYCSECVKKICPNIAHSFLCPLCRQSMKFSDVSLVDNRECEGSPSKIRQQIPKSLKGSHSTKVGAILETVLELRETHPGEKLIVFSMWVDVLEIIAKAFHHNDITYCLLNQQAKKFQTELERFKRTEDIQVLLMPLSSGSKGLNIIEATHVLLVEPILSLASELQAVGRVHRIGQNKSTFVHRFYIKDTIEEQLCEILKTHDVSSDSEGALTVADLENLIKACQVRTNGEVASITTIE